MVEGAGPPVTEATPWLALGLELRLTTTDEGSRRRPIGAAPEYPRLQDRPNWGLPGTTGADQVGAPVLCFGAFPLEPGD